MLSQIHADGAKLDDHYTLHKKKVLGSGVCGNVLLAVHDATGEKVAVRTALQHGGSFASHAIEAVDQ